MMAAAVALALYVAGVLAVSGRGPVYKRFSSHGAYVRYEKARVLEIEHESLRTDPESGLDLGSQSVKLRILTGERRGTVLTVKNSLGYAGNVRAEAGSNVIVCVDTADRDNFNVWIFSYDRGPFLALFVGVFIVALCVIGGGRGVRSVLGILFTFTGIVFLFIPLLYRGVSPSLAAAGVVVVTLCVCLILIGGFSAKTLSAILGSLSGIAVSYVLLAIALALTHLSGFNTSESDALIQIAGATRMKVGELLFAAVLISSLGAIMDVAISIASAVNEVSRTTT